MKRKYFIALTVLLVAVILVVCGRSTASWTFDSVFSRNVSVSSSPPLATAPISKIPQVKIRSSVILVELARTTAEIKKGLSGRISLGKNEGMLFEFAKPAVYQFWMPNMYFPIDIVWINEGKVVDISANVSNDFDPVKPSFYAPSKPVRYVLEVNAGFAARNGIQIGDTVTFKNIGA